MTENPTILELTAFAGLAGAILTQVISLASTYFTDKRKQNVDTKNQYRTKMVEIGENYYYITGEMLAAITKNVNYWKNNNPLRSPTTIAFIKKETLKFNSYIEKLNTDNWKFNLVGMYYDISYSTEEVHKDNERSHQLYLRYLDLSETIESGNNDEQLYQSYAAVLLDMTAHYEAIYQKLSLDMYLVRNQMLSEFSHSER